MFLEEYILGRRRQIVSLTKKVGEVPWSSGLGLRDLQPRDLGFKSWRRILYGM